MSKASSWNTESIPGIHVEASGLAVDLAHGQN